jgi:Arc/MetJ-type ribon-helix-helix transcriptional regulator
MTRRPVTITNDQMRLVEGAIAMDRYASRSELLREAFREYFRENEVLLAVLLAAADDIDPVDGIAAVDADPDNISDILGNLDDTLEEVQQDDILEKIVEDIQFPSGEDTA